MKDLKQAVWEKRNESIRKSGVTPSHVVIHHRTFNEFRRDTPMEGMFSVMSPYEVNISTFMGMKIILTESIHEDEVLVLTQFLEV